MIFFLVTALLAVLTVAHLVCARRLKGLRAELAEREHRTAVAMFLAEAMQYPCVYMDAPFMIQFTADGDGWTGDRLLLINDITTHLTAMRASVGIVAPVDVVLR